MKTEPKHTPLNHGKSFYDSAAGEWCCPVYCGQSIVPSFTITCESETAATAYAGAVTDKVNSHDELLEALQAVIQDCEAQVETLGRTADRSEGTQFESASVKLWELASERLANARAALARATTPQP